MIGTTGTYGSPRALGAWYDPAITGATFISDYVLGTTRTQDRLGLKADDGRGNRAAPPVVSGASAGPMSGDYVFPDGYTYRLDNSGWLFILRSPRSRITSPVAVSTASTAGQAILRDIAAHPEYRQGDTVAAGSPFGPVTTSGGTSWAPPPDTSGLERPDTVLAPGGKGDDVGVSNAPVYLLAALGVAVGVGILVLTRGR